MNMNVERQLLFLGMLLFFIGLVQGGLIPYVVNPRMALSAHLAAVQGGMALLIFGLIWGFIRLPNRMRICVKWLVASGLYLIWIGLTLASFWGASEIVPIAGAGYRGSWIEENVVKGLVVVGSISLSIGVLLALVGLFHSRQTDDVKNL